MKDNFGDLSQVIGPEEYYYRKDAFNIRCRPVMNKSKAGVSIDGCWYIPESGIIKVSKEEAAIIILRDSIYD